MKKALLFSLFLSIFTFYGIQKYSGEVKEKLGINDLQLMADETNVALQNNSVIFSVSNSTPEPALKCIKFEGRIYCKSSEKII
ncbi:hypothetical protein BH23BAC1_BH23BAC1_15340 [soil metagenome]